MHYSPELACRQLRFCENNTIAAKGFTAIHGVDESLNIGDINTVDMDGLKRQLAAEDIDDIDIITSTFPCQTFSHAGKQRGFDDDVKGNLFDRTADMVITLKPRVLVMENVKNILARKFNAMKRIKNRLEEEYSITYRVLAAHDYGVPQARYRWFCVCLRRDVFGNDAAQRFVWPEPVKLEKRVRDYIDTRLQRDQREVEQRLMPFMNDTSEHKAYNSPCGAVCVFDGIKQGKWSCGFTRSRIFSIEGCRRHL